MRLLSAETLSCCGVGPKDRLLVGLSGGADSVALLHGLWLCYTEGRIGGLFAAHLIHGIRAGSAEADAAFCETLCKRWGIPLVIGRVDSPAYAHERGMTLEQAARELRYAFLREQAARADADGIAVAHHADDQAETLLMHLMRGSGRAGLAGMRARTGDILRPLLTVRRSEIEAYLLENGLDYCTDETNAQLDAARNRVRHELLPLMKSFNPRITEALGRLAAHMAEDEDYFAALADTAMEAARLTRGLDREKLSALPAPVQARVLHRLLRERLRGDFTEADMRRLKALLTARTGSCIELRGGQAAWLENEALLVGEAPRARCFETPFIAWGETLLPEGRLVSMRAELFFKPADGFAACADANAIPAGATVRTRRDGDRFYPLGAAGSRLLSDYLIDKKCPRTRRDMPLLCDGSEVLWVTGYTVSERLRVKEDTAVMMRICYEEDGEHGTDAG